MISKGICSMNNLSDRIINYAKDVNNHGNGVIYYRNRDHGQYEMAASYFSHAIGDLYNIVYQNGGKTLIPFVHQGGTVILDETLRNTMSYKL